VPPTDAELVQQALAGSQDACQALVARYAAPAVNLATRMVRDRALAEDLAQEAFARAFDRLATYNQQARFSSWFFQILHNVTIDSLRRKRHPSVSLDELEAAGHPGFPSASHGDAPDERAQHAALSEDLRVAIAALRPEYREAVVLRYQEELPVDEIARVMDLPVGTVKTYLFRARKELAALMADRGWAPHPAETSLRTGP
jgi:RNA polymerase sigma-70 factor (ECF subfamily)